MSFDKNKAVKLFRVKSAETIKNQLEEIKQTAVDFAQRNATNSGMYIKAHTDLYVKHIKAKLQIMVDSIFEQIGEGNIISQSDEKDIINYLRTYVEGEISQKQSSIKQVLASTGINQTAITTNQMSAIASSFHEEMNLKNDFMQHLIEKHNARAKEQNKNKSFWQTRNGAITAVGTAIIAFTGIITMLASFGLFSHKDDYLNQIPIINKFSLTEKEITIGNTIQISWDVSNVDSVVINSGIGKVILSGTKNITPKYSTTFILSAYLDNIVLSMSKRVVVKDSSKNAL